MKIRKLIAALTIFFSAIHCTAVPLQAAQNIQDIPLTSEQINDIPENPEGIELQNTPAYLDNKTIIKNSSIEKASNTAYELDQELLNYTNANTGTRQYACEAAGGIYFLQGRYLRFWDFLEKEYRTVYEFSNASTYIYCANDIFYWSDFGKIILYDMAGQKEIRTIQVEGITTSYGIGADAQGRIYLSAVEDGSYKKMIYLLSAEGDMIDKIEVERTVYEFSGFGSNGVFYFLAYYDFLYWGYSHDMAALFTGRVESGKFKADSINFLKNIYQFGNGDHQDCATLFGDRYLADSLGSLYDIGGILENKISSVLLVEHNQDEQLSEYYDLSSIGTRMLYNADKGTIIAYTSNKNLFEYDLVSKKAVKKYRTSHYVFNLLKYGDNIIAIERESGKFYMEIFSASDFQENTMVSVNLNETAAYASHTKEAVLAKRNAGKISSALTVYKQNYSLSPYRAATYTDGMKKALLDYGNYLRWLGGLTPLESAPNEIWENAAKGAVVLQKTGELSHSPNKPGDMDESFFNAAYQGCAGSNLSYGYDSEDTSGFMDAINGLLDDTANISSLPLAHRFEFLQRSGYQAAYGSAGKYFVQTTADYKEQINCTGTIEGMDNNDYCYPWPSPGYFPTDAISTAALWSFNLNTDKINLSNEGMSVMIKDLDTGKTEDVTDSIGTSAYYGFNNYFGYFKGACFYFNPPKASSYSGKNYQVIVSNLELPDGAPAEMVYTVRFVNVEDPVPKKNTKLEDAKTKAVYTVTKAGSEVAYAGTTDKKAASITIPSTVTIKGITYKVTSIAKGALKKNKKLKTLTVSGNVKSIGANAFSKCTSLKKVTIGSKVKKIGAKAFYHCSKLKKITIKSKKLTKKTVGSKAFLGIHAKAVVKAPKTKLTAYKKLFQARGVGSQVKYKK